MKQPSATEAEISAYMDTHEVDPMVAPEAQPFALRCMATALQGWKADRELEALRIKHTTLIGGLKDFREAWENLRAAGLCGGPGGSTMLDLVMSNTEALLEVAEGEDSPAFSGAATQEQRLRKWCAETIDTGETIGWEATGDDLIRAADEVLAILDNGSEG